MFRNDLKNIRAGLKEVLSLLSNEEPTRLNDEHSLQAGDQLGLDSLKQIVLSDELPEDETLFRKVITLITDMGYASTMVLQHRLEMHYRQAANIIAELERAALIGPAHGFRPHKVLPAAYAMRGRMEESPGIFHCQNSANEEDAEDIFYADRFIR